MQFHNIWTDAVWAAVNNYIYVYSCSRGRKQWKCLEWLPCRRKQRDRAQPFLTMQFKVVLQSLLSLSMDCRKMKTVATHATWYEPQGWCFETKGKKNKKRWLLCVTVQNVSLFGQKPQKVSTRISTLWCFLAPAKIQRESFIKWTSSLYRSRPRDKGADLI